MQQYISFIKWQVQGITKSWSCWGVGLGTLGLLLSLLTSNSVVISQAVVAVGVLLILADAVRAWISLSYSMYQREQQQIVQKLSEERE